MNQNHCKKIIAIAFLVIAGARPILAQNTSQLLDSQFISLTVRNEFNGNVLIAAQGKTVYQKSFGFADVAKQLPNTGQTAFHLASISKTFTSVAILQLLEKGKLKLEDHFVKYFPEFPFPQITIRHLMNHTSGLIDFQIFEGPHRLSPEKIFSLEDLIPAIKADKRALAYQTGERWSYSNTGYGLLALLVERLSKMKFQDYLSTHLFKPAEMSDTYIQTPLIPVSDPKRASRYEFLSYAPSELKLVDSVKSDHIESVILAAVLGPTAVVSSAPDMLKYDHALYSGKLLKTKTLTLAFQPALLNSGEKAVTGWGNTKSYYGLGWMVLCDSTQGKVVWHSGGASGIVTAFLRNLTKHQTLVVLDNVTHRGLHGDALEAFYLLNHIPNNKKKHSLAQAYAITLHKQGIDAAAANLLSMRSDTANYYLDEHEFNRQGYSLANDGFEAEALEMFKINTFLFPASFNTYDSYGDMLNRSGKKKQAILMFEYSIALNPDNEGGKKTLAVLKAEMQ